MISPTQAGNKSSCSAADANKTTTNPKDGRVLQKITNKYEKKSKAFVLVRRKGSSVSADSDHSSASPSLDKRIITSNPPPSPVNDERERSTMPSLTAKFVGTKSSFPSNHMLINEERMALTMPSLARSCTLDMVARVVAEKVEQKGILEPDDMDEISREIHRTTPAATYGVNIGAGLSTWAAHDRLMWTSKARDNILDRRFEKMGVGTCRAPDGSVIVCQLFKGTKN